MPYEPFEYKTADGTLTGFEIDLGNAVCERLEIQCTWVEQPWDGMIPALMARKFDAIMSSMAITEERSRQVLFSEPYYTTPSAWITPRGRDIDIADKASLEGLSVGVQRATLQDRYVTDLYGDVLEVRRYASADDVVADLRAGRLDLTFMDYPIAEAMIDIDTEQSDFVRISVFTKTKYREAKKQGEQIRKYWSKKIFEIQEAKVRNGMPSFKLISPDCGHPIFAFPKMKSSSSSRIIFV